MVQNLREGDVESILLGTRYLVCCHLRVVTSSYCVSVVTRVVTSCYK